MRIPSLSRAEWAVIVVTVAAVVALLPPTPHWREIVCESCHLCGNRQARVREYRWWQQASDTIEPLEEHEIAAAHQHDWWQYSSSYISYSRKSCASKDARYRDGRVTWSP